MPTSRALFSLSNETVGLHFVLFFPREHLIGFEWFNSNTQALIITRPRSHRWVNLRDKMFLTRWGTNLIITKIHHLRHHSLKFYFGRNLLQPLHKDEVSVQRPWENWIRARFDGLYRPPVAIVGLSLIRLVTLSWHIGPGFPPKIPGFYKMRRSFRKHLSKTDPLIQDSPPCAATAFQGRHTFRATLPGAVSSVCLGDSPGAPPIEGQDI